MIYIIKRDDEIISVLSGPAANLMAMETAWLESKAKPVVNVLHADTCVIDAFQQAKARHGWDEFQEELLRKGFKVENFRECDTLMRMNHHGTSRASQSGTGHSTGNGHAASDVDANVQEPVGNGV